MNRQRRRHDPRHDVLAGTHGHINGALDPQKLFRAVTHDSREVQAGDLFIALVGETQDGHRFVPDALERGARAVLVNESFAQQFSLGDLPAIVVPDTLVALQSLAAYWRNTFSPHVIGITGSIGKSSTKEVVAGIAGARFNVHPQPPQLQQRGRPATLGAGADAGHRGAGAGAGRRLPLLARSANWQRLRARRSASSPTCRTRTWAAWARWKRLRRPRPNWSPRCQRMASQS
jgi:hypothetical protein